MQGLRNQLGKFPRNKVIMSLILGEKNLKKSQSILKILMLIYTVQNEFSSNFAACLAFVSSSPNH